MRMTRRHLLTAALGASQVALLERFGLPRLARADGTATDGPTRLLTIYLQGGVREHYFWWPLGPDLTEQYLPPPTDHVGEPAFGTLDSVKTVGEGSGGFAPLQMIQLWNPDDPAQRDGTHTPLGYGWQHYDLLSRTAVVHGIDQVTNAHQSGYIAAMCGIAGSDYRAPAIQSVVANHFYEAYADERPLPCVAIDAAGLPASLGLPGRASAIYVPNLQELAGLMRAKGDENWWWNGLDARRDVPDLDLWGKASGGDVALTDLEETALANVRRFAGRSSTGTDAFLEQLHDTYAGVSRTLAKDVVGILEAVTPVEYLVPAPYLANVSTHGNFGYNFGANFNQSQLEDPMNMVLRVLKSGLATSVHAYLPQIYYDTHSGFSGHTFAAAHLRAQFDCIARMLGEMDASPSGTPGKSLLDDTLVLIFSEFGRNWAYGPGHADPGAWSYPDDHHPATTVTLVGGGVAGNRMIGSFDMPHALGVPVEIREESGETSVRVPRAADLTATACCAMGLGLQDFFIPGGFGEILGVRAE